MNKKENQLQPAQLNLQGVTLFQQRQFESAMQKFQQAAELNPAEAEYPNNLGMCYLQTGNFAMAEKYFTKAVSLNRGNPLYYYNLGLSHIQMGKSSDAVSDFSNVVKLDNGTYDSLFHLGLAYYQSGDNTSAQSNWEKALKKQRTPDVLANLGMFDMNQDRVKEAESKFQEAIKMNPNHVMARYNYAVLLHHKLKKMESAREEYSAVIDLDPMNYASFMNRALVNISLNHKKEAIKDLERFIQIAPPGLTKPREDAKKRIKELQSGT